MSRSRSALVDSYPMRAVPTLTEVGTTCIHYKDWETHRIRRSFTTQFHPELMADIRDIGRRAGPRYAELKDNDGVRLIVRLLYHGMQE